MAQRGVEGGQEQGRGCRGRRSGGGRGSPPRYNQTAAEDKWITQHEPRMTCSFFLSS